MKNRNPIERRTSWVLAKFALLVFTLIAIAAIALVYVEMSGELSAKAMEEIVKSWGPWGVAGSIGLMMLHSFVPFPAEFLAIANGMIYGSFWGTVITWIGAMLGATLAFGFARVLGRPFVALLVARKNRQLLDELMVARGTQILLVSRFIPVIAFNLINYAAGLTRISWWTFLWTTGIGILPLTILMVVIGDYMEVIQWEMWVLFAVGSTLLWLVLHRKFQLTPRGQIRNRAKFSD